MGEGGSRFLCRSRAPSTLELEEEKLTSINAIVRGAIARHAGRDPSAVRAWHRLDRDLDLTPLELVQIALEVQEVVGVEVPVEELAYVETVGDVFSFISWAVPAESRARFLDRVA
jgi:acyl carrier protein